MCGLQDSFIHLSVDKDDNRKSHLELDLIDRYRFGLFASPALPLETEVGSEDVFLFGEGVDSDGILNVSRQLGWERVLLARREMEVMGAASASAPPISFSRVVGSEPSLLVLPGVESSKL